MRPSFLGKFGLRDQPVAFQIALIVFYRRLTAHFHSPAPPPHRGTPLKSKPHRYPAENLPVK
jgi:hypothetical protein